MFVGLVEPPQRVAEIGFGMELERKPFCAGDPVFGVDARFFTSALQQIGRHRLDSEKPRSPNIGRAVTLGKLLSSLPSMADQCFISSLASGIRGRMRFVFLAFMSAFGAGRLAEAATSAR